jgi:predicted secreted protein
MPFVHGKSAVFKVDNSGGSLTDISAYCDNVDFPITADTAEVTTFGDSSKEYVAGLKDATISISGSWDATADGVLAPIVGQSATVSFEYGPAGSTASNIKFTGECICTSYNVTAPVGDKVSFSAEFQVTGAVTRGTY